MQAQRKRLLLCLFLFLSLTFASVSLLHLNSLTTSTSLQIAKNASLIWEKTFGGTGDDRAFCVTAAEDGYLVVGSSTSFEQGKTVAWVLRLDNDGNALWNRTFSQNAGSEFRHALNVEDGFLLVGNTFLPSGGTNGYAMKIDKQGKPLWNLTLGEDKGVNKLFSACESLGDFLLVGLTDSLSNGHSDVWLIKLDANGGVIWNKTYGGTLDDAGRAVTLTQDNCYMVAGYTDCTGNGDYDFLALKIDESGNALWSQTYGGPQSDKAYAIAPTADGCVIAGDTRSKGAGDSDAWVIKVDVDGKLLWEKTFGGCGFDAPTCITLSCDDGFLIGGTTFSFGNGQRDFWLFKVDNNGKIAWSCTVGRSSYEEAYAVLEVDGDEFVMAGWTNSIGEGSYDFYVVKLGQMAVRSAFG